MPANIAFDMDFVENAVFERIPLKARGISCYYYDGGDYGVKHFIWEDDFRKSYVVQNYLSKMGLAPNVGVAFPDWNTFITEKVVVCDTSYETRVFFYKHVNKLEVALYNALPGVNIYDISPKNVGIKNNDLVVIDVGNFEIYLNHKLLSATEDK